MQRQLQGILAGAIERREDQERPSGVGEEKFEFGQTVFTGASGLCGHVDEPGFHRQSLA